MNRNLISVLSDIERVWNERVIVFVKNSPL